MNWINAFELICYGLTILLARDMIKKKNSQELLLFFSAVLAGFILELLAVRLTEIYHYSNEYFISIGTPPYQFPFFGGLMWGGLTVCALRIAKKFEFGMFMTSLLAGWLVVSMDLLLDVAAIRLNGGFWIWEGRSINLDINHHMFLSVIWVNFLGYLFETPALVYFTLISQIKERSVIRNIFTAILVSLIGVLFVGTASALSLLLDGITDEWFSYLVFIGVWCFVLMKLLVYLKKYKKISLSEEKKTVF